MREAVEFLAGRSVDEALGDKVGLMPMLGAKVVTEITALEILYQVEAKCIGAGGVVGSEGAVVLVIDGEETQVKKAMAAIKEIKGEPSVQ